jgi:hypothetical protein
MAVAQTHAPQLDVRGSLLHLKQPVVRREEDCTLDNRIETDDCADSVVRHG